MKAQYVGAVQRLLWFSFLAREEIYFFRVLNCQNRYKYKEAYEVSDVSS
jgi:hypothetical protein